MLCQRTSWTSTAQMVAAQLFTSLLLSLIRKHAPSVKKRFDSRSSPPPCPVKSSDTCSTVLTDDPKTLIQNGIHDAEDYDLDDVIAFPGGYVSFLDNQGIMRTERAHYDPLGGRVDLDGETNVSLADVIDMLGHHR